MNVDLDIIFKNYSAGGSISGPVIVKNKNVLTFSLGFVGSFTSAQTFYVGGFNLTGAITITAPAGFIINTDNSNTDMSPLVLNHTGGSVPSTLIYVKFNPASAISYGAVISMTSPGCTTRNISVFGLGLVDVAPVYTPAVLTLGHTSNVVGEFGEYFSNVLSAIFANNDAGAASLIRIQKNGSDMLPNGSVSPFNVTDNDYYSNVPILYIAYVNYAAGPIKSYLPSGTPDARVAAIRNVNAPQAAENNLPSATISLIGDYAIFSGPSITVPANSIRVRGLPVKNLLGGGGIFQFHTGVTDQHFSISIPASVTLIKVVDVTAGNVDITASFTSATFNVNDAAGNPQTYETFTWSPGVPFFVNHIIEFLI